MGLFSRKPKIVKEISDGAWGYMVSEHNIDVDTLSRDFRCVEKSGNIDDTPVKLLRIFRLSDLDAKKIEITDWETFDQYPELVLYEGYLNTENIAKIEKRF